ncbi:MAG: hypothetical protein LWX83_01170 [Anaerolineae bacterium]|nr:hypothetical protein [Anaerolineae bacterium]
MTAPAVEVFESLKESWGLALQPAGCPFCKQVHLISSDAQNRLCPACNQADLIPQPAWLTPSAPELIVPFAPALTARIPSILEKFVNEVWLKPDDFNLETLRSRMRPLYWTQWLVDGQVIGNWKAESGFDYQVKSSQEFYKNNSWQSQELIEGRIRWEVRLGQIKRLYQNISIPAFSQNQQRRSLIGDYDLRQAAPYHPDSIGAAFIQTPDLQPQEVWQAAQAGFNRQAGLEVQQASQAQHLRNFSLDAAYESLNWTQLLLPLYSTFYRDDEGCIHSILINGQTGSIGGVRLASQRKGWQWAGILGIVSLVLLIFSVLCLSLGALFPPVVLVGTLLVFMAIIFGIAAIFPAVSPWQWNRSQQNIPRFPPQSNG